MKIKRFLLAVALLVWGVSADAENCGDTFGLAAGTYVAASGNMTVTFSEGPFGCTYRFNYMSSVTVHASGMSLLDFLQYRNQANQQMQQNYNPGSRGSGGTPGMTTTSPPGGGTNPNPTDDKPKGDNDGCVGGAAAGTVSGGSEPPKKKIELTGEGAIPPKPVEKANDLKTGLLDNPNNVAQDPVDGKFKYVRDFKTPVSTSSNAASVLTPEPAPAKGWRSPAPSPLTTTSPRGSIVTSSVEVPGVTAEPPLDPNLYPLSASNKGRIVRAFEAPISAAPEGLGLFGAVSRGLNIATGALLAGQLFVANQIHSDGSSWDYSLGSVGLGAPEILSHPTEEQAQLCSQN